MAYMTALRAVNVAREERSSVMRVGVMNARSRCIIEDCIELWLLDVHSADGSRYQMIEIPYMKG